MILLPRSESESGEESLELTRERGMVTSFRVKVEEGEEVEEGGFGRGNRGRNKNGRRKKGEFPSLSRINFSRDTTVKRNTPSHVHHSSFPSFNSRDPNPSWGGGGGRRRGYE